MADFWRDLDTSTLFVAIGVFVGLTGVVVCCLVLLVLPAREPKKEAPSRPARRRRPELFDEDGLPTDG